MVTWLDDVLPQAAHADAMALEVEDMLEPLAYALHLLLTFCLLNIVGIIMIFNVLQAFSLLTLCPPSLSSLCWHKPLSSATRVAASCRFHVSVLSQCHCVDLLPVQAKIVSLRLHQRSLCCSMYSLHTPALYETT